MLAGFLNVQNFAAFVVAALGTDPVRHFALVAVRALRKRVRLDGIVRAAAAGAGLGMAAFWIWHEKFLLSRPRAAPAGLSFLELTACYESLSEQPSADLPSPDCRSRLAPGSSSCRTADTNPCSLLGIRLLTAPPAEPAREESLRAAGHLLHSNRFRLPRR